MNIYALSRYMYLLIVGLAFAGSIPTYSMETPKTETEHPLFQVIQEYADVPQKNKKKAQKIITKFIELLKKSSNVATIIDSEGYSILPQAIRAGMPNDILKQLIIQCKINPAALYDALLASIDLDKIELGLLLCAELAQHPDFVAQETIVPFNIIILQQFLSNMSPAQKQTYMTGLLELAAQRPDLVDTQIIKWINTTKDNDQKSSNIANFNELHVKTASELATQNKAQTVAAAQKVSATQETKAPKETVENTAALEKYSRIFQIVHEYAQYRAQKDSPAALRRAMGKFDELEILLRKTEQPTWSAITTSAGLSILGSAVTLHAKPLVKFLVRYGNLTEADLQSALQKANALNFNDIAAILTKKLAVEKALIKATAVNDRQTGTKENRK